MRTQNLVNSRRLTKLYSDANAAKYSGQATGERPASNITGNEAGRKEKYI